MQVEKVVNEKNEMPPAGSISETKLARMTENVKSLTAEMIKNLKEPLPPEAVAPHPTKTYLSTIKAIYVVERLNDVFGIGKWYQRNIEIPSPGKMKSVHSYLEAPEYGIYLDHFGGNDNIDE